MEVLNAFAKQQNCEWKCALPLASKLISRLWTIYHANVNYIVGIHDMLDYTKQTLTSYKLLTVVWAYVLILPQAVENPSVIVLPHLEARIVKFFHGIWRCRRFGFGWTSFLPAVMPLVISTSKISFTKTYSLVEFQIAQPNSTLVD